MTRRRACTHPRLRACVFAHTHGATGSARRNACRGLGQLLGQEAQRSAQSPGLGGLLNAVFDRDGDGKLGLSDLLKIGGGLLGGNRPSQGLRDAGDVRPNPCIADRKTNSISRNIPAAEFRIAGYTGVNDLFTRQRPLAVQYAHPLCPPMTFDTVVRSLGSLQWAASRAARHRVARACCNRDRALGESRRLSFYNRFLFLTDFCFCATVPNSCSPFVFRTDFQFASVQETA